MPWLHSEKTAVKPIEEVRCVPVITLVVPFEALSSPLKSYHLANIPAVSSMTLGVLIA